MDRFGGRGYAGCLFGYFGCRKDKVGGVFLICKGGRRVFWFAWVLGVSRLELKI